MYPFIWPYKSAICEAVVDITRYLKFNTYIEPYADGLSLINYIRPNNAIINTAHESAENAISVIKYNPTMMLTTMMKESLTRDNYIDPIRKAAQWLTANSSWLTETNYILNDEVIKETLDFSMYLNTANVEISSIPIVDILSSASRRDLLLLTTPQLIDHCILEKLDKSKIFFIAISEINFPSNELNLRFKNTLITQDEGNKLIWNFR